MSASILIKPDWRLWRSHSVVLNKRVTEHHVRGYSGPLSLKMILRGECLWETTEGKFRCSDGEFVIFNRDQEYSTHISSKTHVEPIVVGFEPGFVEDIHRAWRTDSGELLDRPLSESSQTQFHERIYRKSPEIEASMRWFRRSIDDPSVDQLILDERLRVLAHQMLTLLIDNLVQAEIFPGRKASTREEMFRRLVLAQDFAHSCVGDPLSVSTLAQIANMSPAHFHRAWSAAFGITPGAYIRRLRLSLAAQMLSTTDNPITLIAGTCGFESLGSFSWAFRKRFGCSPKAFRKEQD